MLSDQVNKDKLLSQADQSPSVQLDISYGKQRTEELVQVQFQSNSRLSEHDNSESLEVRKIEILASFLDRIDKIENNYHQFFNSIKTNIFQWQKLLQKQIQREAQQFKDQSIDVTEIDLKELIEKQFSQVLKDDQVQRLRELIAEVSVINLGKIQSSQILNPLKPLQQNAENEVQNKILIQGNIKYVPLSFVQQKWELYQKEKAEKLSKQREIYTKKVEQLQESVEYWKKIYTKLFEELREAEKVQVSTQTDQKNLQHLSSVVQFPFQFHIQPINFQLVQKYKNAPKQSEWCNAIAFDQKSSLMIAACKSDIKVFQFKKGQLQQVQQLRAHSKHITTLYFMKRQDQFISGGDDNEIIIWGIKNNWEVIQKLTNGHTACVEQVIMNEEENLLISCSDDFTIKFWNFKSIWDCYQTLKCHNAHVYSISLNDSQKQLVSCGGDKKILIMSQARDKKWSVVQEIQVDQSGCRICFIGNDQITFQPAQSHYMEIYRLEKKKFRKDSVLNMRQADSCYYYFPQIFDKEKQILLNKNGETLYLMKRKNYYEFKVEQQISFNSCYFFGAMTPDGKYLVTWDSQSCQFQVREQQ